MTSLAKTLKRICVVNTVITIKRICVVNTKLSLYFCGNTGDKAKYVVFPQNYIVIPPDPNLVTNNYCIQLLFRLGFGSGSFYMSYEMAIPICIEVIRRGNQ